MRTNSIGDALFTKTQQKVLGLLFGQFDRSFYTNEIMRLASIGRGTISRELDRLVAASLLTVSRKGNQNHYQANPCSPIYEELKSIVDKSLSANDEVVVGNTLNISRTALNELIKSYHIRRLVLFGSAARGELTADSDIDLLIEFEDKKAPSLGGMVTLNEKFSVLFGGRKIDIATPAILNNPYRKRAIEKDMEELYAA
ncbi:MAG: ArsR family transcriptional regulator [Gammaproteobacteria bacterium]|nr:ArsR family transcriptional regulator [Gammaproteobacteria bacterium]